MPRSAKPNGAAADFATIMWPVPSLENEHPAVWVWNLSHMLLYPDKFLVLLGLLHVCQNFLAHEIMVPLDYPHAVGLHCGAVPVEVCAR